MALERAGVPLLVIAGPTASGKTGLAIKLAAELDAELIGADSMQVYRYLDIGTDKPTASELGDAVHHLIDVVDPDEEYDAARFIIDADRAIADVHSRGKRAVVVGGSGLYIRALLYGLQGAPPPDPALRSEIAARAEKEGWPALHRELAEVDPETAARLHCNDGVRILRALEVYRQSGVAMSTWQVRHRFSTCRYRALVLGIERPRQELNERIDHRVGQMMERGFLDEVRGIIERGFGPWLKPLMGLGYRRLCQYLAGETELEQSIDRIHGDTRRLARRQRTWFRDEPGLSWVAPDVENIAVRAKEFFAREEASR